ncbi:MAG: HhoA/HhoB/HtrA family serine endopeptidase [Xenococcaceae cyanobacterium MO_188.B29]|nr:HhoA/HhoB/HtrA family serine endopeptidase [Xenococcaceae cyanobacterium MO_188.B29]
MSSTPKNLNPLSQFCTHTLAVVLTFVVTLTGLRSFPQILSPLLSLPDSDIVTEPNISLSANTSHNFVVAAVKHVGASVVRIDTERTITRSFPDPLFDNPWLREFFGDEMFPQLPREYYQRGQGSGFIIDRQGIILTNAHVVIGADRVRVSLRDGRTFEGEVRGIDRLSDLAVVKIEGKNLPIAPLGNSSELEVGDWAIAVGNPLGLDNTVTLGIISTLNRSSAQVGIRDLRLDFIQTDAAINPGNSGGPLLNEKGEVIGINTAIRAGAEGIGFAIPIDKAKAIQARLARGEKISHPYIGIQMLTLTPELAQKINQEQSIDIFLSEIKGVLVVRVLPNSPAAVAGLRRGDVITEIEGTTIISSDRLQDLIDQSQIGQPLKIKIRRETQTKELWVKPKEIQEMSNF